MYDTDSFTDRLDRRLNETMENNKATKDTLAALDAVVTAANYRSRKFSHIKLG